MPTSTARILLAGLLLASACSEQPTLPPPGANRAGSIQLWPGDAERPFVIHTSRIEQVAGNNQRFTLYDAAARWRTAEQAVELRSPWASNDGLESGKKIRFGGPIHLSGVRGEIPFAGRAERGWITDDRRLVLEEVVLHSGSRMQTFPEHVIIHIGGTSRWQHGPVTDQPAPAWWRAWLAVP